MIVLESKSHRRLAGRLGDGAEAIASLLDLCRNHRLGTAEIRGIGYLRNVRLLCWDGEVLRDTEEVIPRAQVLSLLGNVSRDEDGPSVHVMVQLRVWGEGGGRLTGGRLVSAEVVDLEFFIDAIDDFGFVRMGEPGGLMPWLQIDSERHVAHPENDAPSRSEFLPGRLGGRAQGLQPEYELRCADTLDHPKLGRCVVLELPDDDRARIRVERTQRVVELHLGLLQLVRQSGVGESPQHFRVRMRKRA